MAAAKKSTSAKTTKQNVVEEEVAPTPTNDTPPDPDTSDRREVAEEEEAPTNEPREIDGGKVVPDEPALDHAQRSTSSIVDDTVRGRWTQAKAVLYTDGLSGDAEQNLERAYEYNERLQSNNPAVRRAGDESLSESALEARDDRDSREAEQVIEGGRQ